MLQWGFFFCVEWRLRLISEEGFVGAEHTTAVQSKYKMIKPISNLSIINVYLEIVISHDRLFPNWLSVGRKEKNTYRVSLSLIGRKPFCNQCVQVSVMQQSNLTSKVFCNDWTADYRQKQAKCSLHSDTPTALALRLHTVQYTAHNQYEGKWSQCTFS